MTTRPAVRAVAVALAALVWAGTGIGTAAADPNALWDIVDGSCVPDQEQRGDPAPCAQVDRSGGYAVLKDLVGRTQFLLIPTARIDGIESPQLLAPDAPNYFAAAWRARSFVDEAAGMALPRDWVSLAINSADGRSQNQLHIHVDCVRADVYEALTDHQGSVGARWAPFPVPLAGHAYDAIAVSGADLDAVNPFGLLAEGIPGARADMGSETLVVVGTVDPAGRPGFVILANAADPATGDMANGEDLQGHASCPPAALVNGK